MFRSLAVISLALFLSACDEPKTAQEMDVKLETKFQYVIDPNTGLCFVRYRSEGAYANIHYSYVPCTDDVKNNLFNPQK